MTVWLSVLMMVLSGCGAGQTATLRVTSSFESTMMFIPDEEKAEQPEPVYETIEVRAGDDAYNSQFHVDKLSRDSMTITTYFDYYARSYRGDEFVKDYGMANSFTFHRGETLSMTMAGLLDADSRMVIIWPEAETGGAANEP